MHGNDTDLRKFEKAKRHSIYDKEIAVSGHLALLEHGKVNQNLCQFCCRDEKAMYSTFGINWGRIRDHLIRLAAHYTEHYASDILYDLATIERNLSEGKANPEGYFFGFRSHGIDGNGYVAIKHDDAKHLGDFGEYRAIWRVMVDIASDLHVEMSLHRVEYNQHKIEGGINVQ